MSYMVGNQGVVINILEEITKKHLCSGSIFNHFFSYLCALLVWMHLIALL